MLALISVAIAASVHFGVVGGPDFREALVVEEIPLSLNPLIGDQDPAVHDIGQLLYRSLMRLDATGYPRPDLAQSYTIGGDGLTYQFVVRPAQRWSSGAVITPADVAATVAFVQTTPAVDHGLALALQGVKVSVAGATVSLTLAAPHAAFLTALTQVPILPLGRLTHAQLVSVAAHPSHPLATSGPYRVSLANDSGVNLISNTHAATRPRLPFLRFDFYSTFSAAASAFTGGGADAMLATTPQQRAQLMHRQGSVAHEIATFQFVDLLFNERVPGLDDPAVRRAIATAVNRTAIVGGALDGSGGVPQDGAVSQGLAWIAGGTPKESASPAVAAQLLTQAGWSVGPDGTRVRGTSTLNYTLTVANVAPLPTVATELAAQLAEIGISVHVQQVPADKFVAPDVTQHDFELALGDWYNGPDPDVSAFWRSNATPPDGVNVSGAPPDPFLDQALDILASATDGQARIAAAASVSHDLAVDAPAVFLYTPVDSYVVRSSLARTPVPPLGGSGARFADITSWHH